MSFAQTATNKVTLVGAAIVGTAFVVSFFGALHVAIAGGVIAGVGYAVAAYKNSDGPSSGSIPA